MPKIIFAFLILVSSNVYAINNCNPYIKSKHFKQVLECSISTYEGMKQRNLDRLNQPLTESEKRFQDLTDLNNGYKKLQIQVFEYAIGHRKQLIEALGAKQVSEKRASDIYKDMLNDEEVDLNKIASDQEKATNEYAAYKLKSLDDNSRSVNEILSRNNNPPTKDLDITCEKTYYGDGVRCRQR